MKIMKKAAYITVAAVVCALLFGITNMGCSKAPEPVNYDVYTVGVSLEDMRGFGSGVVLKQENGKIYCLSATHLFDKSSQEYYITFYSGKPRKVLNVRKISGSDLAVAEVDGSGLKLNRDYKIPQFARYTDRLKDVELHIFNDGYYRIPFRKMIGADDSAIYLPGKMEKGRSGSPLFIKDHPVCLGIVSGYYTAESENGEKVIVLMPEKEYCADDIVLKSDAELSFWEKLWKLLTDWF